MNYEIIAVNLIGIKVSDDFRNDIIEMFETEEEVIISKHESDNYCNYQVYENTLESPIICIKLDQQGAKIADAWVEY